MTEIKELETAFHHAAEKLVEADSRLHDLSPDEKWNRYTEAILKLRSALVDSHDEEVKAWAKRLAEEIQLRESCNRLLGDQAEEIVRLREAAHAVVAAAKASEYDGAAGKKQIALPGAIEDLRAALDASPPKPVEVTDDVVESICDALAKDDRHPRDYRFADPVVRAALTAALGPLPEWAAPAVRQRKREIVEPEIITPKRKEASELPEIVTVDLRVSDAVALIMGQLDYTIAVSAGQVPSGGSPMTARVAIARELAEARPDIQIGD